MCFHVHTWHMSQSKPTARQPWYFLLLALVSKDALYFSTLSSLFCRGRINIFRKPYTHTLELLLINSDILHFFDHTRTHSRHPAKSLGPYLKGGDLHLTSEITLYFFCAFQKSQWWTPQLWWAARRSQQVSIRSVHLAHKHHRFMRGTKTYFLIFLDLSFKVWNKY